RRLDRLAAGLGAGVAGLGTGLLGARSAPASGEVLPGVAERAAEHHVGDGRADDHAADRAEHAGTDHRTEAGAGPGPASEAALEGAGVAHLRARRHAGQVTRVVRRRTLCRGHRVAELGQDLAALLGCELRERLGVRLLDAVRGSGAQQVAVALDRDLVLAAPRAARRAGRRRPVGGGRGGAVLLPRRRAAGVHAGNLVARLAAEQSVEEAHGLALRGWRGVTVRQGNARRRSTVPGEPARDARRPGRLERRPGPRRTAGTGSEAGAHAVTIRRSERADVLRLQALGALLHVELDALVLLERAVAARLDGAEVSEDVLPTVLGRDE